jgi:type VI secretion system protein ImpF
MATSTPRTLLACLYDRLTDLEPRNSREVPPPEWEQVQAYKAGVARDLTNLLNARRSEADIPEEFKNVQASLASYGVRDFTTAPMDREEIRTSIERAVRVFEPRLSRVQVVLAQGSDSKLSFRISGILYIDVAREPVVYDAELPKDSRRFRVTAGR